MHYVRQHGDTESRANGRPSNFKLTFLGSLMPSNSMPKKIMTPDSMITTHHWSALRQRDQRLDAFCDYRRSTRASSSALNSSNSALSAGP